MLDKESPCYRNNDHMDFYPKKKPALTVMYKLELIRA